VILVWGWIQPNKKPTIVGWFLFPLFSLESELSAKKGETKKPANAGFFVVLSGWQDSNLRPPAPKAGAIPGYATPRTSLDLNLKNELLSS